MAARTLAVGAVLLLASCNGGMNSNRGNTANSHSEQVGAFTVTDLGTLGGSKSDALGINNRGEVVGYSLLAGRSTERAFLFSGGKMIDLGTLGGDGSWATSVNDNGQVVGWANTAGGATHGFFLTHLK
jgi:probable HAF family extracellular repeat protein